MENKEQGSLDSFLNAFGVVTSEARKNVLIVVFVGMVSLVVFLFYENRRRSQQINRLQDEKVELQSQLYERIIGIIDKKVDEKVDKTVQPTVEKLDTVIKKVDSATVALNKKL